MARLSALLPLLTLAIVALGGASARAADATDPASPAVRIAAAVIAERAREQAIAGGGPIAAQLDTLARALAAGQVSLNDAALVMHIAMAGAMAPPRPLTANVPKVTPEQVVALLDGTPPAAGSSAPAAASTPLAQAPAATSVLTPPPAAAPAGTPPVPPTVTPVGSAVATVLAVGRIGDGKTELVMVSAGSDKHLTKGQRLLVLRNDKLVAQLGISDLRDTMAVCVILAPVGAVDVDVKEGDAVFASGE